MTILLTDRLDAVAAAAAPERVGTVSAAVGLSVDVTGTGAAVGDLLTVDHGPELEVVAVQAGTARCMPVSTAGHLRVGMRVRPLRSGATIPTGRHLFGRVLDGLGRPIDGKGPLTAPRYVSPANSSPNAMTRARITAPVQTGVRVLDTLTTLGRGQRIGLFAGSGVGKSSLLSMIARGTDAEVSVIALIGERGREVREFLEDDLGEEGLARSVVIVATSDEPALMRLRAAFTATRIAESFRDDNADVVLMMDSLTRVAMAQREIGLSVGEPPATRGYPPSTFSTLARLLERAGTAETGSVTGIYTVLVDGDDHNEPIADAARSILDGHVVLDRRLAVAGHFPAIDPLASISRVASKVTTAEQRQHATTLRQHLAAKQGVQDLIDVGAYREGANRLVDQAIAHDAQITAFLRQSMDEQAPYDTSWAQIARLTTDLGGA
ncbi:FliI/YscN family ATPase [Agromyces humi]|uniref:FliI/YscN family ATPase n=1 Tax=Agromyces humi TaxID=1766800 RepID=UPI00135BA878|nr:FliI/YscN family ATPase [Agromyces humi]